MSMITMSYATLRIYGEHLDPARISELLGINPTSFQVSGDKRGAVGREREVNIGGWFLTSKGSVESSDISDHVRWLLKKMPEELSVLSGRDEVSSIDMFCCLHVESWNYGFAIDVELLAELGRFGVGLDFDVYHRSEA